MMGSPNSTSWNQKEQYVRSRENPYFKGLIRVDDALIEKAIAVGSPRIVGSRNMSSSVSDIGDKGCKDRILVSPEKVKDTGIENSVQNAMLEPLGLSSSERWRKTKITKTPSFAFPNISADMILNSDDSNNLIKSSNFKGHEENESGHDSPGIVRPPMERSYSGNKWKQNLLKISLPQSAASYYSGGFPPIEIVKTSESISRLNLYIKSRRDDVMAGVPGRFLHAVIGQDASDVASVASTIMYAFYLNETLTSNQLCTVPVINMKRADVASHAALKWILDSCQIDQYSLIFVDEIDLSYYDLFGSLKVVLLNGNTLPPKQEALKEAVVEIFNNRKDCSSCTLIAEKFALSSPGILAGKAFSRLLLAGILLDTGNLTHPRCTAKDKYIATLLINGAGRYGCNGLSQILRFKMCDVSNLKVVDILCKDFKKWTRVGQRLSHIGMSSIGISIENLLGHGDTSAQDIKAFQHLERLRLLMIVSGYYDEQKKFKREILVSAGSVELMNNLLVFLNSNASQLPLKVMHRPGLIDEMRAFEIDKFISRKALARFLEDFGETSKS